MGLEPGKNVSPQLRLVRAIGRGAMGSVWVADHLGLGAQVAVKFLSASLTEDPVSIERFRREARAAAQIRSPHVVQTYDHGVTADGQHFIVMELLDGESLERRVRRVGPLDALELARVVGQTCKGLARAHAQGIIHRDIKPANIFLQDTGDERELFAKVLDFGVAKFVGEQTLDMTGEGKVVGTPAYMSPEQLFHGKAPDHRWDLWSLGVCAYFALTGARPFEGSTIGELCVAIKRCEFARPSALRTGVPPDVDAWFVRALHADLDARFKTARDMAEALEAAIGVPTIMQSTPGMSGGFKRASGGHLAVATHGGTSIATLVGAEPDEVRRARRRRRALIAGALGGAAVVAAVSILFGQRRRDVADGVEPLARPGADVASAQVASPPTAPAPSAIAAPSASSPASLPPVAPSASADASAATESPRSGAGPRKPPPGGAPPDAPPATAPAPSAGPPVPDDRSERAGKQLGI
jgi:serine/threonine-protein kinase